jgi:hypothetical protein
MSAMLAPGDVIDGIALGEPIAGGTMARIFRATRAGCDFPLVVKVPRLGHGEPGASVVSYEVETLMLSRLTGPHVPRFVAAGALERVPYIAMEHVAGEPLAAWAGRAPLDPAEVARIGAAIANAVHALHQQEAIHLDLKPSNILLRPAGDAVLLDFGLAHHARFPDLLAEEFRRPIGTAPYISPEQVLGVRNDPRSDLFAIGVILYELATGRLPFGAPGSPRGMRARLHVEPEPPRALAASIPEWLQEIILRCLEPDAAKRPASAGRLAFDLANPDTIEITDRGRRTRRAGWGTRFARWLRGVGYEPEPPARPAAPAALAPILLVAVGGPEADPSSDRARAMGATVRRTLAAFPDARLVCATVIRPVPDWGTSNPEETAAREHLRHRVALRNWAAALALPVGHVTFHVLESNDPCAAVLEYVRANAVDHLVLGEPQPFTGSIGGRLAAEAPCTVTIVRI